VQDVIVRNESDVCIEHFE